MSSNRAHILATLLGAMLVGACGNGDDDLLFDTAGAPQSIDPFANTGTFEHAARPGRRMLITGISTPTPIRSIN